VWHRPSGGLKDLWKQKKRRKTRTKTQKKSTKTKQKHKKQKLFRQGREVKESTKRVSRLVTVAINGRVGQRMGRGGKDPVGGAEKSTTSLVGKKKAIGTTTLRGTARVGEFGKKGT